MAEHQFRKYLPPDVSSDWHQIMAKALYARMAAHAKSQGLGFLAEIKFTKDELRRASDAEFEYGWDGDSMIFRPAADTSIPGERKP